MRFLLFLLLGTLIFGMAFPAMIAFIGLFGILLVAVMLFRIFRGGSGFTVYTSRGYGRSGESVERGGTYEKKKIYTESEPEVVEHRQEREGGYVNVASDEDEIEEACEIVELPATALRKDEDPASGGEETRL